MTYDFSDACDILGVTPTGPLVDDDRIEGYPVHEDEFGVEWTDFGPMDQVAPGGSRTLTIQFDTQTELEAQLTVQAVAAFMRRRTTAFDITIEYTNAQGDG